MNIIPFNKPLFLGKEKKYLEQVFEKNKFSGEGEFNSKCSKWFEKELSCLQAFPTPSCTASLEMAILIAGITNGDEVILPSYTFTSTATAIVMQGGIPVFIDSKEKTLNINENLIESAITNKTKAIMPVHYAGVSCEMTKINEIAKKYNLTVIEDAAQCTGAFYENKPVGSMGDMSAFSFHETKNINCGEGGMLCINNPEFLERAEIIRDKGTNRRQFFRGQVDKYSWQDKGSSYLMSELQAAFLFAQLENVKEITQNRIETWNFYHASLEKLEKEEKLERPFIPSDCEHNAHIYYIILPTEEKREFLQTKLKEENIFAVSHYVPLHSSVAGKKFGRTASEMKVCESVSARLLRLPMYYGITQEEKQKVINVINKSL